MYTMLIENWDQQDASAGKALVVKSDILISIPGAHVVVEGENRLP